MAADRGDLVGGQLDRSCPTRTVERLGQRAPDRRVRRVVDARSAGAASRPRCRRRPTMPSWSASSSSKASRRSAASRPSNVVRVVGLLERRGDRPAAPPRDGSRRAGTPGRRGRRGRAPRGSRPAGGPRSARPSAGRPARSGRRGAPRLASSATAWNSGLSNVSRRPKRLTLPDTTTSPPTCSRRSMKRRPNQVASIAPGLVLEPGDRALDPPPERRLDPDVARRATRAETTVPSSVQTRSPSSLHLAQVVVAPRQVEQQVADVVEAEPDAGPRGASPAAEPGLRRAASTSSSTGSVGAGRVGAGVRGHRPTRPR